MKRKKSTPSEFDGENPFPSAESSGSCMVWVVPSIGVHVLALIVWMLLPEKEARVIEKRAVSVNSQQAQQLQEFVENANLRELRVEVSRLQEIQQALVAIRSDRLDSLTEYEQVMRESVEADATQVLAELGKSQSDLLRSQRTVQLTAQQVNTRFAKLAPLIEAKEIERLSDAFKELATYRKALSDSSSELKRLFMLLQAQLDSADSVLSWQKNPDVVQGWEALSRLQQRALAEQGVCVDQLDVHQLQQRNAMARLESNGAALRKRVEQSRAGDEAFELERQELLKQKQASAVEQEQLQSTLARAEQDVAACREAVASLIKARRNDRSIEEKDVVALREELAETVAHQREVLGASRKLQNARKVIDRKLTKGAPKKNVGQLQGIADRIETDLNELTKIGGAGVSMDDVMLLQREAVENNRALMQLIESTGGAQ